MTEYLTPGGPFTYNLPVGYNCFDIECWGADTESDKASLSVPSHPGVSLTPTLNQGGYIKMRLAGITSDLLVDIGDQSATGEYAGGLGVWTQGTTSQTNNSLPPNNGGGGSGVRLIGSPDPIIVAGGAGGCVPNYLFFQSTPGGPGGADVGGGGINSESANSIYEAEGGTQTSGGQPALNGPGLLPNLPPGPFFLERPGSSGTYKKGGGGPITQSISASFGGETVGGGGGLYGGGCGHMLSFIFPDFNNGFDIVPLWAAGAGGSNGSIPSSGVIALAPIVSLQGGSPNIPQNPNSVVGPLGLRRNGAVRITPVGWVGSVSPLAPSSYVVPDCIYQVRAQIWGGNGGPSTNVTEPSLGGYCEATIDVTPGIVLDLYAGQAGQIGGPGLSPSNLIDGGEGGSSSVGGGGAGSAIVYQSTVIMVAGGGGGSSQDYQGGNGGGLLGFAGDGGSISGGGGVTSAPGSGGISIINSGAPGMGMLGGDGASSLFNGTSGGGGGGGGHFGGGGGGGRASLESSIGDGAGGGGSSLFNNTLLPITGFITGSNLEPNPEPFGNGIILITPGACVCVAQGTMVSTLDGEIPIEQIRPGQFVQSQSGWVRVRHNITMPTNPTQMVFIGASSFNWGSPSDSGLMISKTHPMLIDGVETTGQELLLQAHDGIRIIKTEGRTKVYTLVTEQRDYVRMNNTLVGTWGLDAWTNFLQNDSLGGILKMQ